MKRQVDLVWLGGWESLPSWGMGRAHAVRADAGSVHALVGEALATTEAEAWLFWDEALGTPQPERVRRALDRPGDVWHAGLLLGAANLPGLFDFVHPTWMLNRDPDPDIEATSWRLSLRACLVRTEALRQMGDVHPEFTTLEGAALEMGHRYITRGVLMRHVPWLVPGAAARAAANLPLEDQLRFLYYRCGRKWSLWALGRAILTGLASPRQAARAAKHVYQAGRPAQPAPFLHGAPASVAADLESRVTVIIPTLERYPYLRRLLGQLGEQTVRPLEVIVVDQTPKDRREAPADEVGSLPLRVLYLDQPGQCSSRNAAVQAAQGEYLLFLDDDDEVPPDLIERHLRSLHRFSADVSCGVADEVGAGPLPEDFAFIRASDVFPTNNILVRRSALAKSGLFDLAYDHGARADGDLGMRVYLSGAMMVLNPEIRVLHHHAPRGGLRAHGARVVTYASSRARLTHRNLPSATEMYLVGRYFTSRQVREHVWLSTVGTFSIRGNALRKCLKVATSLVLLPHTLRAISRERATAVGMTARFPQIPTLPRAETQEAVSLTASSPEACPVIAPRKGRA